VAAHADHVTRANRAVQRRVDALSSHDVSVATRRRDDTAIRDVNTPRRDDTMARHDGAEPEQRV
jgi:hypothetical protein